MAKTGNYDAVFHGHNHDKKTEMIEDTLLANPGELAGVKNPPSYGIYDTKTNTIEIFSLDTKI